MRPFRALLLHLPSLCSDLSQRTCPVHRSKGRLRRHNAIFSGRSRGCLRIEARRSSHQGHPAGDSPAARRLPARSATSRPLSMARSRPLKRQVFKVKPVDESRNLGFVGFGKLHLVATRRTAPPKSTAGFPLQRIASGSRFSSTSCAGRITANAHRKTGGSDTLRKDLRRRSRQPRPNHRVPDRFPRYPIASHSNSSVLPADKVSEIDKITSSLAGSHYNEGVAGSGITDRVLAVYRNAGFLDASLDNLNPALTSTPTPAGTRQI